jgi:TonB family protein
MFDLFFGVALKSAAVFAGAWTIARLLRRGSAGVRHLVWTAAAAIVLVLPFLSISLPALRLPGAGLLPTSTPASFQTTASTTREPSGSRMMRDGAAAASERAPWRPNWGVWLMLIWAAGTATVLAHLVVGYGAMWRIRRSAKEFPDRDLCEELSDLLGIRRRVGVLETGAGVMPMTFGLLRPAVFMPADAMCWTEERRRAVLLHELAHVRRRDMVTQLVARAALSLYWWNPLAWIAWREFLKDRERATDDLVLSAGTRASDYAGHLLETARAAVFANGWAAIAAAGSSQLEGRVTAILDSSVNRKAPGRASVLAVAVIAAGIVGPLAAVRAQEAQTQAVPADVNAAIRAASSQKNYQILETAADAATHIVNYGAATHLQEAAVAIRAQVSGFDSAEYGIGLLKLADLKQKQDLRQDAEALYRKAAQVLGERPQAARAWMRLGSAAVINKDFAQAFEFFQHAQRIDPAQAGLAQMWMAVIRHREQNDDEADRLFKSALAVQDLKPADARLIMRAYTEFLRKQGRMEEAAGMDTAIRKADAAELRQAPKRDGVYRIGNDVTRPQLLQKVEPEYTEEAKAASLTGTEVVYAEIGPDGLAHNAQVLRGLGLGLDEKGLEALSQWRFRPGTKDGQPVTVAAVIEINWKLL